MSNFYGGTFFSGGFFGAIGAGGGKGDNPPGSGKAYIDHRGRIRYQPYKPTGLPFSKPKTKVDERVEQARQIHEEVSQTPVQAFVETPQPDLKPIPQMTLAEIDAEIGLRLRAKLNQDNQELLLLLMIASQ